jgi:hypothetical protein
MALVCSQYARFYAASRMLELFSHTRMAFRSWSPLAFVYFNPDILAIPRSSDVTKNLALLVAL